MGAQRMDFLIKSENLAKMSTRLKEANRLITSSVRDKMPILIRHHADCDGYSGAVALERAILREMGTVHRRESDMHFYFRRLPSRTPFYDVADALKDTGNLLSDQARFERKAPLVIVIDNGSCEEDQLAIKLLKQFGAKILVIDHHPPHEETDRLIEAHVNPMLEGLSGGFTAGMLCAELAHMIEPKTGSLALLAALAGVSDRSAEPELAEYLKLSEKEGYDATKLRSVANVLDFLTNQIGYQESRYLIDDLFFGNIDYLENIVRDVTPILDKQKSLQLGSIKKYAETIKKKGHTLMLLTADAVDGSSGRAAGMLLDHSSEEQAMPVIAVVHGPDFATIRISKALPHTIQALLAKLTDLHPYAQIEGGGHPKAGTARFLPASRDAVLATLRDLL
jgi:archaea-specific RecJ-like exonuclease